jgi:hypothetical protein
MSKTTYKIILCINCEYVYSKANYLHSARLKQEKALTCMHTLINGTRMMYTFISTYKA